MNVSKDEVLRQASNIWSMLDDMREKDPVQYRKFIDKQMKEGKEFAELNKPPELFYFLLSKYSETGDPFNINIVSWNRLKPPKSSESPVPIASSKLYEVNEEKCITIAFNRQFLEDDDKELILHLIKSFIKENFNINIIPNSKLKKNCSKGDLKLIINSLLEQYNIPQNSSAEIDVLKKFAPIANSSLFCNDKNNIDNKEPDIIIPGINDNESKSKLNIIEEIPTINEKTILPEYEKTELDDAIQIDIKLPGIKSTKDISLEMNEEDFILVATPFKLEYNFQFKADWSNTITKFSKKLQTLQIKVPKYA